MALAINTNVASLNAQRALQRSNSALSTSFQRLSTGLRINSAKDDAAGLAISNRFTSQIRGLNQAIRNANDGISLAQTTESALNEVGSSLQRLRELSVQSANDTNTASDRAALQAEADQLIAEIERVATQTTFNGNKVLDGTFQNRQFQIGADAGNTLGVSISSARTSELGQVYEVASTALDADFDTAGDLTINGVDIGVPQAGDDPFSNANNDDSAIAVAAAINRSTASTGVSAVVTETSVTGAVDVGTDVDATTELAINGVSVNVGGALGGTGAPEDAAFASRLADAVNTVSSQTGVTASVSGTDLTLTAEDGRNIDFQLSGTGAATFGGTDAYAGPILQRGGVRLVGDEQFNVGGADAGTGAGELGFAAGNAAVKTNSELAAVDLSTQSGAESAIETFDAAIRQVSSQQADLGAILSRFESTVSSLSAVSENLSAARSRIQDADFAAETAEFTRNQILQQASTSILAQANVSTQVALSLLG